MFLYNSDMDQDWTLRVNRSGCAVRGPQWRWDISSGMPDYDMVMLHAGVAEYHINGRRIDARPGSALLFRPGDVVTGTTDPENPISAYYMHFDLFDSQTRRVAATSAFLPPRHRQMPEPELLLGLMDRVAVASPGGARDAWGQAALCEVTRADAGGVLLPGQAEQAGEVEAMCARIRHRPERAWKVSDLAREFGCSSDHLCRLFRKYVLLPPSEVILRARTTAARSLLAESDMSLAQIAEALGYGDVYAFNRQFRQRTGQPPGRWRKRVRGG